MSILCKITQFEDKCRKTSYVKSEMKRHLVTKYGYLRLFKLWLYEVNISVLSAKRFDIFTQMHFVYLNMMS